MQTKINHYAKQEIDTLLSCDKKFWTTTKDVANYITQIENYLSKKGSYKYFEIALLKINLLEIENENKKALNFALEIIEKIPTSQITLSIADIYNEIGILYSTLSNSNSAIEFFDKAATYYKQLNNDERFIQAIINKANVYMPMGENDKAEEIYLKALKLSKSVNDEKLMSMCYSNIGLVYMQKSDYHKSLKNYMKAMKLYEKINNEKQIYVVMANLGLLYFLLGNHKEAINYSLKAIEMGESLKEWNRLSQIYNNLGSIYLDKKNMKKSEQYLKKAMNLKIKIGDKFGLSKVLNNLSEILRNQKRNDEALEYLKKSLKIKRELDDKAGICNSLLNIGNIFADLKKYPEALKSVHESEKIVKKLADDNFLIGIYEFYYTLYSKMENDEKTLFYYKQYVDLFFENYNKIHDKKLNNLMTKFEDEKAEKEKKLQYLKNIELKKANTTKDRFFSIIAHDLKSPFSAIVSFITLMKLGYDKFSPERIESLINELDSNVKNTYTLLENLLTWSRMQSKAMKYIPQNINVRMLINKVFNTLQFKAEEKKIKLINNVVNEHYVYADYFMLQTIIRNLVNNAIKFTFPEGTISLSAKKINAKIEITIIDTGIGISQEKISKLFKIESSFSTYGTNKEKGTGLGLILCKEFIEKNNGEISVESEVNKGTTFFVELPSS